MEVYIPIWKRKGNTLLREYTEFCDFGNGNTADVTFVDYINKKGELQERVTKIVKWKSMYFCHTGVVYYEQERYIF